MSEGQRDFGPPWRDLIEKYLYRGDVSEKKPVEIWLFKTSLGQGLRPRETGFAFHGAGILDLGKANVKVLKTE